MSKDDESAAQPPGRLDAGNLTTYHFYDAHCAGIEAFQILIPTTWQVRGGVVWQPNNPAVTVTIAAQIANPNGSEVFEMFPTLGYYWTSNPLAGWMMPGGMNAEGYEARPLIPVLQALREVFIPRFRNTSRLNVIAEEVLPQLGEQYLSVLPEAPAMPLQTDGGRLRISYPANAEEIIEEDVFGVVIASLQPMLATFCASEIIFWQLTFCHSIRAPAGRLDNLKDLYRSMVASFKINPHWFSQVNHPYQQTSDWQNGF